MTIHHVTRHREESYTLSTRWREQWSRVGLGPCNCRVCIYGMCITHVCNFCQVECTLYILVIQVCAYHVYKYVLVRQACTFHTSMYLSDKQQWSRLDPARCMAYWHQYLPTPSFLNHLGKSTNLFLFHILPRNKLWCN